MPFINKTTKRTNRGIVILIVLLSIIIFAPRVLTFFKGYKELPVSITELNEGVAHIEESKKLSTKKRFTKSTKFKVPPRKFDPSSYTVKEWMYLGLSEKQASTAVNYFKRGAYNEDYLKRCFVIKDELFQLIKDSVNYTSNQKVKDFVEPKAKEIKLIDINSADEEGLMQIRGIGEYYAKKIVEYRSKLGGFHSKEQLLELYKFDQEKLERVSSQIVVGASNLKRLNINSVEASELAAHPYISWKVANSIVKMRTQIGKYSKLEQLLESELIDKALLEKIRPYLEL